MSVDALYEQVRRAVPVASSDQPPVVVQITQQIRVVALRTPTLPPAAHTNTYLVGPEAGPHLVVDPGSPWADQQAALEAVARPGMVLLTHHHADHVGGATALAGHFGVPIAAHAATARRLTGRVKIDVELGDGEQLEGVTCLHTPGHADGHLCFEVDGAVIAGDMVAGLGWILIDPDEGNMTHYLASLARLLARGVTTLLPAHGPPIVDGPGKLREYITHRTMREDRVLAALAAREASTAELVGEVYADTPRPLWPLAERSLRAHLDKLVHESRARETSPGRWTALGKPL